MKKLTGRSRPECPSCKDSFPSGHSAAVWVGASVLGRRYPKYKWIWYITASSVSVSRVYLGKHYPSDVVVGAMIGYIAGELAWHYRDRIKGISFR